MKRNKFEIFTRHSLWIIFVIFLTSCDKTGSNNFIIKNNTNDKIFLDLSKLSNPIDTLVIIDKLKSFNHLILKFEDFNIKTNNTVVENEISKLIIFKVVDKDTIYLPLSIYNNIEKWELSTDDDFGYLRNDFYLTLTDEVFE